MSESATIILGDEYDDSLRNALREVLLNKGATIFASDWSVGGSQELETIKVQLNGQEIIVESETFIGLSIRGPKASVEAVAREVKAAMAGS